MRNYILAGILILVIITISGCTYNSKYGTVNETREVSGFNQIVVTGDGPIDIIITQGSRESLAVETGKREISNIKTEVSNNKLYLNSSYPVEYYVTVKDINSIEMNGPGPGDLRSTNLKLNNLTIKINNGVGHISNLTANNLNINQNNSYLYAANLTINNLTIKNGDASAFNITDLTVTNLIINNSDGYISGKATNQKVTVNGVYDASNLTSETADIYINGPGKATVRVSDFLKAFVISGDFYYIGKPKITKKIIGWGTITQIPG